MSGTANNSKYSDALFRGPDRPETLVSRSDQNLFSAVVGLLIGELEDTEQLCATWGTWDEKDFSDPRIADIAGHVLCQLDPRRFPFDLSATMLIRDRSRFDLIDTWRKEHALSPISRPPSWTIAPVPEAKVARLLDRLQNATTRDRTAVENELERLGPGAVTGILKRRKALKVDDPFRPTLERTRRLAYTVIEVQLADKSLKPNGKVATRLDRLKARPLDVRAFTDLVSGLSDDLSKPSRGFRLCLLESRCRHRRCATG